jgi:hypothetical protein
MHPRISTKDATMIMGLKSLALAIFRRRRAERAASRTFVVVSVDSADPNPFAGEERTEPMACARRTT